MCISAVCCCSLKFIPLCMFLSQQFKIPDGCKLEKCAEEKGVRAKISVFILKN